MGWIKDAGRRTVHLLGFCSALQRLLSTQPSGWGDGGEGTLPSICRRNTTNTHTRANGNSQQNKHHGGCWSGVCGRAGGGRGEPAPASGWGHCCAVAWAGCLRVQGSRRSVPKSVLRLPGESLSFIQMPGLESQGSKAVVSYNPLY